jgi:hypothetical protein
LAKASPLNAFEAHSRKMHELVLQFVSNSQHAKNIVRLMVKETDSDFEIKCDGDPETWHVHRAIISAKTSFFDKVGEYCCITT